MKLPITALTLLLCSTGVHGWGTLGHQTVAYIATNIVSSSTKSLFQSILKVDTDDYLAGVATWADSFRYTKAGRYSEPYHFIDAQNDPPTTCGVVYSRDCGNTGCVVAAIQNYTSQLLDSSVSAADKLIAAKFVIHFVGDIHQPLHDEAIDRGGNSIPVLFNGVSTNLHAIWDTNMLDQLVGGYTLPDAKAWAANLTSEITSGSYEDQAASWLEGIDLSDPVSSAMTWAQESNQWVCDMVLKDGVEAVSGQELSGSYYEEAVPIFELQIARAGYRLANWLDLIAGGVKTEL